MPPKKKKDNTLIKIVALIGILVAVALVMVFFTLPSLGVELFPKKTVTTSKLIPAQTNVAFPIPTFPVQKGVDPQLVQKSLDAFNNPKNIEPFDADIISTWYYQIDNPQEIRRLLSTKWTNDRVKQLPDAAFVSYYQEKNGPKKAWVRIRSFPNKVFELMQDSPMPSFPDSSVLGIDEIGVLVFRYNVEELKKENGQALQFFRILAQPFSDMMANSP